MTKIVHIQLIFTTEFVSEIEQLNFDHQKLQKYLTIKKEYITSKFNYASKSVFSGIINNKLSVIKISKNSRYLYIFKYKLHICFTV